MYFLFVLIFFINFDEKSNNNNILKQEVEIELYQLEYTKYIRVT